MTNLQLNCACVIHGNLYDWQYVENLYAMLNRNLSYDVRLHVFTEPTRSVPSHVIKHSLQEWPGISGRKKAWWYKLQLFNRDLITGPVLYLDLDTVIIDNIDWLPQLDLKYFWAIRDFRYLWKPRWQGLNSSIMYWNQDQFHWIWDQFVQHGVSKITSKFHGDQDFLTAVIDHSDLQFFNESYIKSWRWQVKDGGINTNTREYLRPGAGAVIPNDTKFVIFHGSPKPHEVDDVLVKKNWRST
jgi:hypothetical protein